jgi:hypothetical protein
MTGIYVCKGGKDMVFINVIEQDPIILDCHKNRIDGDSFRLVIDPKTKELLEKPEKPDIDVSVAYSKIFGYLINNKPLPANTVAEWG